MTMDTEPKNEMRSISMHPRVRAAIISATGTAVFYMGPAKHRKPAFAYAAAMTKGQTFDAVVTARHLYEYLASSGVRCTLRLVYTPPGTITVPLPTSEGSP